MSTAAGGGDAAGDAGGDNHEFPAMDFKPTMADAHGVVSVSQVLNTLNKSASQFGGQVELKRKDDQGNVYNIGGAEPEIAMLDQQARIKACAT